jgi:hypothetical protein
MQNHSAKTGGWSRFDRLEERIAPTAAAVGVIVASSATASSQEGISTYSASNTVTIIDAQGNVIYTNTQTVGS